MYNETKSQLFENWNVLSNLWQILLKIIQNKSLSTIYFIVDALDKYNKDIFQLIQWIVYENTHSQSSVKWFVINRNKSKIKNFLKNQKHYINNQRHYISLEFNLSHVFKAVDKFIDIKIAKLACRKKYDSQLKLSIKNYLLCNAEGTFLWTTLVCKKLKKIKSSKIESTLQKFSAGLNPLYKR